MTNQTTYTPALGEINITTGVLESIAAKAATEVKGVSKLHARFHGEVGELLGLDKLSTGAKIKRQDNFMSIDVTIHLQYGYSVPEVALKVQQKVKEQILFMTDLVVQEVNVHVVSIETELVHQTEMLHLSEVDEEILESIGDDVES